ncbi:MAG: hypothetical protein LBC19_03375 [Tannerella sp.]|jgi:nitric oxide reductase large subunit|nr:hypothetical protein [Tannerella sp.]
MNGIIDYIISLINRHPHLPVFFFLSVFFVITQLKYGWQAYHYKTKKYIMQYRIVNKITTVIFLLVITVTIVLFVSCSKEDFADEDTTLSAPSSSIWQPTMICRQTLYPTSKK